MGKTGRGERAGFDLRGHPSHRGGMGDRERNALRAEPAPWRQWGRDLDAQSVEQMKNACALPVSVRGALMPDAHVGYGLPIGGVLATDRAVIPFAVGVDIACRMKLAVLDLPVFWLRERRERLARAIEEETRFGVGVEFKHPRQHPVMDEDWSVSPVTHATGTKPGASSARAAAEIISWSSACSRCLTPGSVCPPASIWLCSATAAAAARAHSCATITASSR